MQHFQRRCAHLHARKWLLLLDFSDEQALQILATREGFAVALNTKDTAMNNPGLCDILVTGIEASFPDALPSRVRSCN